MQKLLYDIFIRLYPVAARMLAWRNDKARKWVKGREGLLEHIRKSVTHNNPVVWVHCASLGEFEQGRPLIGQLRHHFPGTSIVLTFFSPSGYEVQKNFKGADHVFYLPMDSSAHASQFFDAVRPSLGIFIKYEFWHYYIHAAKQRNIPLILASGVFRPGQSFFRWYGEFYRSMLRSFRFLFVQDNASAELLQGIGINNVAVTGDTRFDRVLEVRDAFQHIEPVRIFCGDRPVIVAGSTWTADDEELDHFANTHPEIRFIIAPHDISKARIDECRTLYRSAITFSELIHQQEHSTPANVLIIDNIGRLSKLYHYATIAFIGGGFGADGIHNILEAAVFGKPVVFGPVYDKYNEAVELIGEGGAFSVETALQLEEIFNQLLKDASLYNEAAKASKEYIARNTGAAARIMHYIQEKRLFTT